ncbi:protein of unknown function [Petrocella atlantisensis]|uniref:Uncharacterized protein n=1 Tax=Petrocella atlantisensis TaxID=2173034 RepID=A0A3P7P2D1_9FIRM|nr:hypothetical protein [Petrocella atlantisensis]VDN49245.1 protein of unknown function [Petrocella atlantisensis]
MSEYTKLVCLRTSIEGHPTLGEVFYINDDVEITARGNEILHYLYQKGMDEKIAWIAASINEFEDLVNISIEEDPRCLSSNYCFYESLKAIREAVLCGINGQYHASYAVLRPALELLLRHVYFKKKDNHIQYKWTETGKEKESFGFGKLRAFFKKSYYPYFNNLDLDIKKKYKMLCSYSHTPYLNESVSKQSGTNDARLISKEMVNRWVKDFEDITLIVLKVLITVYPEIVHPFNITNKFGLNRVDGVFADCFNYLPITAVFDESTLNDLKKNSNKSDDIIRLKQAYSEKEDLKLEEVTRKDNSTNGNRLKDVKKIEHTDLSDLTWIAEIAEIKGMMRATKEALCYNRLIDKISLDLVEK